MLTVVVSFVVVFALMLLAVSVGLKYFDARRKNQVVDMLHTASGEAEISVSNLLKEIESDKPSGLKRLFSNMQFSRHAEEMIQQAGLNWSSSRLLTSMMLMMVPGLGLGLLVPFLINGPATAVVLGLIFGSIPYLVVRSKRKKRLNTLEELSLIPIGQEFRALFNEQNLGAPIDIALRNFTMRVPLLDVRFFTSSVLLQKQTGGNLSEILSRLAYIIRERFRLKGQVRACSAHGRMTATILTLMPIATMLALLFVAPGYLQGMANDSDGKYMIGGAIAAQLLGNFFIKKIINIKV